MRIIKNGKPTELSQALKKASDIKRREGWRESQRESRRSKGNEGSSGNKRNGSPVGDAGQRNPRQGAHGRKQPIPEGGNDSDVAHQGHEKLWTGGIARTANLKNHSESSRSDSFFPVEDVEAVAESASGSLAEAESKKAYRELLERGIKLLSMREHSQTELRRKLASKGALPELVDEVIDELLELGYLSDERFCEAYVRSRAQRGFGPAKIRAELHTKGVSQTLIAEYLLQDSQRWYALAEQQYQKKYGDVKVVDYKDWSRRARFLQSRGFSMDHIHGCVPQITQV